MHKPADDSGCDLTGDQLRELFEQSSPGLRRFLMGRLPDPSDVDDCLQAVYVLLIQHGGGVAAATRTAWLFRVAANESARIWRTKSSTTKMLLGQDAKEAVDDDPALPIIRDETRQAVQEAIDRLPPANQEIVRLRIHENLTFEQIAKQLSIPLGTALTRMRRSLIQLRSDLDSTELDSTD
ncbi:RNA polymerase sigma factor [Rubripirellula reticaptiva]|nr:sigma-70 family RNA polymerase sigma factor [Rubripirellula reticaptiva]